MDELAHYLRLQRTSRYLKISELEDGWLYLIHARNSHIGQWSERDAGFVLLREKQGVEQLFMEYHWDKNDHGTAKPLRKLRRGSADRAGLIDVLRAAQREMPYAEFVRCVSDSDDE